MRGRAARGYGGGHGRRKCYYLERVHPRKKSVAPSTKTETPAASPAAGAVASGTEVTLTSATDGAKIYYTLDGSNPTQASTLYEAAITVSEAVTIKAKAYAGGHTASDTMTAAYTIQA
ncbi:chitobiase/beta-hexosaminidase C-terminal domain-containing protein [Ruthenibacterium lactatiformans]|uniref:chitobiase/beta-hexosaminidase C-terminal domain-containing protein n=1 Tax=Ruthenibacterium lactatiformans TaxID=1550024 RepID=UPI0034674B83